MDMMNDFAVWIDDLLGAVKEDSSQNATKLIESCGKGCLARRGASEFITGLREAASDCRSRADFVSFLNGKMPMTFTEDADGIVIHMGKDKCGCKMAPELHNNADALCNCTLGHEKAMWSEFFGKPIDVEIVETILRGGNDCVFKILV
jgi:predicted hydrocarbon binding protein